jgi:hypothetical protein
MKNLEFIPFDKIKTTEYNRVLEKTEMGVYAMSWYMNIVSVKWGIISNPQQKVFLPVAFKNRLGYDNVYQPFFCMFMVPVNIYEENFFTYLQILKEHFHHVEMHLPFRYTGKLPHGMIATDRIRQEVRIDSYTRIHKNYSDNALRSIKKAGKAELQVQYNIKPELVVKEFSKNKGADIGDIKAEDFKRLNMLITASITHDKGFTIGCYNGDELLASAFFLKHDDRLVYLKGSVNEQGKKLGAMYFIFDEVIKELGHEYQLLDFGGSNIKSVAGFYHRLGGKDITYTRITTQPTGVAKIVSTLKKLRRK